MSYRTRRARISVVLSLVMAVTSGAAVSQPAVVNDFIGDWGGTAGQQEERVAVRFTLHSDGSYQLINLEPDSVVIPREIKGYLSFEAGQGRYDDAFSSGSVAVEGGVLRWSGEAKNSDQSISIEIGQSITPTSYRPTTPVSERIIVFLGPAEERFFEYSYQPAGTVESLHQTECEIHADWRAVSEARGDASKGGRPIMVPGLIPALVMIGRGKRQQNPEVQERRQQREEERELKKANRTFEKAVKACLSDWGYRRADL